MYVSAPQGSCNLFLVLNQTSESTNAQLLRDTVSEQVLPDAFASAQGNVEFLNNKSIEIYPTFT